MQLSISVGLVGGVTSPREARAAKAETRGVRSRRPQETALWATSNAALSGDQQQLREVAATIVNRRTGIEVLPMQFGYLAEGNPQMINNARSETVYTMRSFKNAVLSHRCAIPVNDFIDWEPMARRTCGPNISPCQISAPFSATSLANWRKVGNTRALREIRERWRQR